LNYIANLIKANDFISVHRSTESKGSEKEVEKILLKGSDFKDIVGIVPEDLKYTYAILIRGTGDILFDYVKDAENKDIEKDTELESLKRKN